MYEKGIRSEKKYGNIKIHRVYLTNDFKVLFPRIELNQNGEISAIIPLSQNSKLLFHDAFWKDKYMAVISEIIEPHFANISDPVFQYHNLFLSNLAVELKNRFGGKVIAHLHCLPWKFNSNNNVLLFNRLYQLYEKKEFKTFEKEENSTVAYSMSDRIICLSEVARDYLINIHHIDRYKIEIIQNGLEPVVPPFLRKEKKVAEILYVGKVSKDKGVFELLDALKCVNERGHKFKFKIAGSYSDELLSKIKANYSKIDIDYLGQISYGKLKNYTQPVQLESFPHCTNNVVMSLLKWQCSDCH
jgi:glycosyltransferase involved in cell wall biosynthesis